MHFWEGAKKQWVVLVVALVVAFSILGWGGIDVYREAPPIPARVVSSSGELLFTGEDITVGQLVWQSIGGQQVGTIWGHGAYQAPDWSADWLHRELTAILTIWSKEDYQTDYEKLTSDKQAILKNRLILEIKTNNYNAERGELVVSEIRQQAIIANSKYYAGLFSDDPTFKKLRADYAIADGAIRDLSSIEKMNAFFFWTAWAAATYRPETKVTYTNNWPHEPLIDNVPTAKNIIWSIISVIVLLLGAGVLVWYKTFKGEEAVEENPPPKNPFINLTLTPSMKATWKYAAVVLLLFILQIGLGVLTAHYTVEGQGLYGIPLAKYLPYAVTRTWHLQIGVFWIATAFLGAGLFLGPIIGGGEPKFQRAGVNTLFVALLIVVFGSLAGEYLAIAQKLELSNSFFIGHQGYEYVDLGRFWQILLFVGLLLWLLLMARAILPALRRNEDNKGLIVLFTGSAVAIGLFYGSGFFIGARTHMSVMEYWRWWVVHLWVEGFFEVFTTAAIATIFSTLGLIKNKSATRAVVTSTAIFLVAGIPGTFHHLYFSGTTSMIAALGATFSALEVVPLLLVGIEAFETYRLSTSTEWVKEYKWPLMFFLAVSFWNLVGAGIFGFLINPPIALFYMQGLNTTPVHGHAALFGVYGMLALGFVMLILRVLAPAGEWNERCLKHSFWALNIGLALMILLSLLPIGILQTMASIDYGLWYARSSDFMQTSLIQNLRWARVVGDVIFGLGAIVLIKFCIGIFTGHSYKK
ncbi:MAG: nitric oxide reductase large subunit [Bdellovibrionales bacterium RIFOXYD12_FULL_39_22]|nr:MAG: nitric oxide reductase large subunit [Bdellovibrionales bacterium RIFOXYB1_FULL_39_21]OFZ45316.1 MAG: nitric oxide reductase large subunit [Bdellovibrionales bacterium RIFOXYC12_FULL_39_17]OFZ45691.1 MAG: nitric oxide reductase large subunit [Bdellovibrionales bacterium RIFOXYC1_FULL_39_130]OFZ77553.1 MAG: nitric oxide reductase large subunit [Bdellovibrionales bacterium RIFOXYD1_FULL_39_84]OFZ91682.1 MAG: nitric oxide reductase large subunit [Bdellovibrionales bacterium RIFOXYD12_FULL_